MLRQEIHYEICAEDRYGFRSESWRHDSLAEAKRELALERRRLPQLKLFIVRTTMVRLSENERSQARLKAV